jgi:hypothetical protein
VAKRLRATSMMRRRRSLAGSLRALAMAPPEDS